MNRYDWLDAYLLDKPGARKDYKAEWQWFRYLVAGKMFAALCRPGPEHPDVIPGFYSDKRHWNSVYLDGAVPDQALRGMCDLSYRLVFEKLTGKAQREILGED